MQIQVAQIRKVVSNITGVSETEIISNSRKSFIVQARQLSMHFSRWYTKLPMIQIAILHGKDNHGTVIHADSCILNDIKRNKKLADLYSRIETEIKSLKNS